MDGADEGGVGGADKGGASGANKGGASGADKSGAGGANKGGASRANIDTSKKAGVEAVTSTDNSADGGNKVTNQRAGLVLLAFATFAATNCAISSNLAISEGTPLNATTFTSDEVLATFAALANTTLEREQKVCESSQFLFAANHQ